VHLTRVYGITDIKNAFNKYPKTNLVPKNGYNHVSESGYNLLSGKNGQKEYSK
jgi:hypothetical protein